MALLTWGMAWSGTGLAASPPVLVLQPRPVATNEGAVLLLQSLATGEAGLTYQWRKDGVDIPGARSSNLLLLGASATNVGTYRVVATSSGGSVTSQPAALLLTAGKPIATTSMVVPPSLATNDPGPYSSLILSNAGMRVQEAYSGALFPDGAMLITELRFRPDSSYGRAFTSTAPPLQITLSTTPRGADGLLYSFAANRGEDAITVLDGPQTLSSAFAGPVGGPKAFDIRLPLKTPFLYVPSRGPLLLEILNASGALAPPIAGKSSQQDGASSVQSLIAGSARGSLGTGVDAVELVYIPGIAPVTAAQPRLPGNGSFVIPPAVATLEGGTASGTWANAGQRVQQVYPASAFPPGAISITELRFRPDALRGVPFASYLSSVAIQMCTVSPRKTGLSARFDWNLGPDKTVVFSSPLVISTALSGAAGGPKDFDIIVPLQVPFEYNPAHGDLLIDIWNASQQGAGSQVSAVTSASDGCWRVSGRTVDVGGVVDSTVDVIQIVASPVLPKPPLPQSPRRSSTEMIPWRSWLQPELRVLPLFSLGPLRLQSTYGASHFAPGRVLIREVRLQSSGYEGTAFEDPGVDVMLRLSTSQRGPDDLSTSFESNHGRDARTVYSGRLPLPLKPAQGQLGTQPFDIVIPLECPFPYSPSEGSLVVDVSTLSSTPEAPKVVVVSSASDEAWGIGVLPADDVGFTNDSSYSMLLQLVTSPAGDTNPPCATLPLGVGPTVRLPASPSGIWATTARNAFSRDKTRHQNLYVSSMFPSAPIQIEELRWKITNPSSRALHAEAGVFRIRLSVFQGAAASISRRFDENTGLGEATVFSGDLAVDVPPDGAVGDSQAYILRVRLDSPYRYDPRDGNLLVDVVNLGVSALGSTLIATNVPADCRLLAGPADGSTLPTLSRAVEAIEFAYTAAGPAQPARARLKRGPFLQAAGRTQITVSWISDEVSNGRVWYGTSPGALVFTTADSILSKRHEVTLTNLLAGTRYYYGVGSDRMMSLAGTNLYFQTAPEGNRRTRIWAIGDAGTATYTTDVGSMRDAYRRLEPSQHTDVWLMLGDNAYQSGTEEEYDQAVFRVFGGMLRNTVVWPTIGNHETYSEGGDVNMPYLDIFHLPTRGEGGGVPSGTERYYSFDHANIHFVCLDSESSPITPSGSMIRWLKADLDANTNEWLIAYWHSPPYTKGSHDSDYEEPLISMRERIVPILESYGVDLVLSGHSHNYERSYLLDGHTGYSGSFAPTRMILDDGDGRIGGDGAYLKRGGGPVSPHSGAVYVVAGNGGWSYSNSFDHPAMFISRDVVGSGVIDVDGPRLDFRMLSLSNSVVDHFTLLKGASPGPLVIQQARLGQDLVGLQWSTVAGHWYQVQSTADLSQPLWQPASDPIQATGPKASWQKVNPPWAPAQFYRVVLFRR